VGCRETTAPDELVRFVLGPDGELVPDLKGGSFGRGAWVHPRPECLERAPKGFCRSFSSNVRVTSGELGQLLRSAAERRTLSLLASAQGAKRVVLGKAAVEEALALGHVRLLVVATDARAAIESREVQAAIAAGRAVAFGTKQSLGDALGREELGVLGILDAGLARALSRAIGLIHTPEPTPAGGSSAGSTEEA
jgi:predicted RNA-binding protein YlxR (DUF448 family)